MNLAYLEYRLSGGATNTDPTASLGGAMSTDPAGRIIGRTVGDTTPNNTTGVTILDAPGSAIGNGTLAFTASGTTATWAGNGASAGSAVNIGTDGRYILQDSAGGRLHISVVASSLPGGNTSDTVAVSAASNKLFDDITPAESLAGDTEYRCFYVYNAHASADLLDVKIYIGAQPSGGDDTIALGLDLAGKNGTADTIVDETTAPSPAVTFTAPTTLGAALVIGTLAAGDYYAVWQRRTVAAATTPAVSADASSLIVSGAY